MTKEERAEYQREYRKRQRRKQVMNTTMPAQAVRELIDAEDRIKVLEGEIRQLKRELAGRRLDRGSAEFVRKTADLTDEQVETRVKAIVQDVRGGFGTPRPAPKPGAKKR